MSKENLRSGIENIIKELGTDSLTELLLDYELYTQDLYKSAKSSIVKPMSICDFYNREHNMYSSLYEALGVLNPNFTYSSLLNEFIVVNGNADASFRLRLSVILGVMLGIKTNKGVEIIVSHDDIKLIASLVSSLLDELNCRDAKSLCTINIHELTDESSRLELLSKLQNNSISDCIVITDSFVTSDINVSSIYENIDIFYSILTKCNLTLFLTLPNVHSDMYLSKALVLNKVTINKAIRSNDLSYSIDCCNMFTGISSIGTKIGSIENSNLYEYLK